MKLNPINIQNNFIIIHPLRQADMNRIKDIENEIFEILCNTENTKYIPEKRVIDRKNISGKIYEIVAGYQSGLRYGHFITDKIANKVIGYVDIISPEYAKKTYILKNYTIMLEYYLKKSYWGKGIMSGVIEAICKNLKMQGFERIGAICDRNNAGSIKVLQKVGFIYKERFDFNQDYYELQQ